MSITLRRITAADEAPLLRAISDFPPETGFVFFSDTKIGQVPMAEILARLSSLEAGANLPAGFVPSTFFLAVNSDDLIVGRVSIRHTLNEGLKRIGGHIGYAVLPEFRKRGYATEILRLSLVFCRETLKLSRVLLTCDDDNVGSRRTIEANRGVLENKVSDESLRVAKRRYWIELIDPSWPRS